MPITEFLEKNAQLYKDDISLVEINPELQEKSRVTWREYSLIEQGANGNGRCEITWGDFDKRANRFANLLLSRGIKKGDRVMLVLKRHYQFWLFISVFLKQVRLPCLLITAILQTKLNIVLSFRRVMQLFSAPNS